MEPLRTYFGCALNDPPIDFIERFSRFKDKFRELSWIKVLDFCAPLPGEQCSRLSNVAIYKNDIIDGVSTAHALVFDVSHPTSGGGFELGFGAKGLNVPTYMGCIKDAKPSSLLLGAAEYEKHIFIEYYEEDINELFEKIREWLSTVHTAQQFVDALDS